MKFKIIQSIIVIFFSATSLNIFAEESNSLECDISGKITLSNGRTVISALIGIPSIQKFTITDKDGNYILKDIPYGDYSFEATTIEAEPKRIAITCNAPELELSFVMKERAAFEGDEIVILSKSQSQISRDKGFALSIVDTNKASLSSLQSNELLNRTSGIKLRESGGIGSEVQYNINGLSGNSVRIFIDGIPIRNYGSSFSLASIPPSMIERIEVYKGVIPAHLSEDALGGAVNIILKQASINNLATSYSYGSFNTHKWDFNGNYRNEKSGFTAGGSTFYTYTDNNYKVWGDPIYITDVETNRNNRITAKRFHDSYQSAGVNASIGFTRTKWADRLMLGLLYSDMKKDIQHGATMAVVYGNRTSAQNTKMANLRYIKNDIVKNLDISAFGSFSSGVRKVVDTTDVMYNWLGDIVYGTNGEPIKWNKGGGEAGKATLASNLEQNTAGRANMAYEFAPKHKISANILYNQFTRDVNDPLLPKLEQILTSTRSLTKNIFGASYENSLINDKLKLSIFYKHYMQNVQLTDPTYDDNGALQPLHFDKTTLGDGFGGAASFQITPKILLTFSGEKALRMPDNSEVLGNTSENIEISYELKPEQSNNLNIGAILGAFDIGEHSLSGNINFFYRDITDMIQKSLPIGVTEEVYHYENIGKILSKGFDLEIGYNFKKMIFVDFNLSNFNARYNLEFDKNGDKYSDYGERLRNAPYLTFNNNISYMKNNLFARGSQFVVNYNIGYVHEFFRHSASLGGAGKAVIPTQLVHDIGVVYTFPKKKISLGFDVKNLTNEQVFDNWALQKPGRAFFVKLSYNIIN